MTNRSQRGPDNELRFVIFHWSWSFVIYLPNLSPPTPRLRGEAFWLLLGHSVLLNLKSFASCQGFSSASAWERTHPVCRMLDTSGTLEAGSVRSQGRPPLLSTSASRARPPRRSA